MKILIDALNVKSHGGLVLLDDFIKHLKKENISFLLLADRIFHQFSKENLNAHLQYIDINYLKRNKIIEENYKNFHPTILFCFGNFPPTKPFDCTVITFFQNFNLIDIDQLYFFDKIGHDLRRKYISRYLKNTDWVLFQTNYVANSFCKLYNFPIHKTKTFPFFEELRITKIKESHKENALIYPSLPRKHKNIDRLLEAWEILFDKGITPKLVLTIPFETKFAQKVNALINKGLNIENVGQLDYLELQEKLPQFKYCIYPTLQETIGLGLVEAQLAGCYVLASDLPFIDEIIIPTAKFDPFNAEAIANIVKIVLSESELPKTKIVLKNKINELIIWMRAAQKTYKNMHTLIEGRWTNGFLDYYLLKNQIRIKVDTQIAIKEITDQFIEPTRSIKLVFNYAKRIGVIETVRKIISRQKELNRNKKYLGVGIGEIIESNSSELPIGTWVNFITTNQPLLTDSICIDENLVTPIDRQTDNESIKFLDLTQRNKIDIETSHLEAWNEFSGIKLEKQKLKNSKTNLFAISNEYINAEFQKFPKLKRDIQTNWLPNNKHSKNSAALIGLGQYAKTVIIPNIDSAINLELICEIDPLQIGIINSKSNINYSTNPSLETFDFDIYFIAGYHHTHSPLLLKALENGKYAVVEKPLCTTFEDLELIKSILEQGQKSTFFVGFHKRYYDYNEFIYNDLKAKKGDPINYNCFVYEIPLPEYHWYNWPNSKTRIVSNGCHWIDHFMFLNNYEPVIRHSVQLFNDNRTFVVSIELKNGANFNMILGDEGSPRVGVRENIEIRKDNITIKIIDAEQYIAENELEVFRNSKFNPLAIYKKMYKKITEKIVNREFGDSIESLRSTEISLILDEEVIKILEKK